jgi:hypothetical protein
MYVQDGVSEDDPAEGEDEDGRGHSAHGQDPARQAGSHPARCQLVVVIICHLKFSLLNALFLFHSSRFFALRIDRPVTEFMDPLRGS